MNYGRILGAVMGLVILVSIFLVPLGRSGTMYTVFVNYYAHVSTVQGQQGVFAAYIFMIAWLLLLVAGFVGYFPLGAGVLGVVGMAMITGFPLVANFSGEPGFGEYGAAFFVNWAASVVALGASFWHPSKETRVVLEQRPPASPESKEQPTEPSVNPPSSPVS